MGFEVGVPIREMDGMVGDNVWCTREGEGMVSGIMGWIVCFVGYGSR